MEFEYQDENGEFYELGGVKSIHMGNVNCRCSIVPYQGKRMVSTGWTLVFTLPELRQLRALKQRLQER